MGASLLLYGATATAAKRAFLIGIADYEQIEKLRSPPEDVEIVGAKLKSAGYSLTVVPPTATKRKDILIEFDKFVSMVDPNDDVVVFYSGHGIDVNGASMIVPSDAPRKTDLVGPLALEEQLIPMRKLMSRLSEMQPAMQLWIFDACRSNPYETTGRPYLRKGGLAQINDMPIGVVVFYAASYNQVAADSLPSDRGAVKGSPFSRSLVRQFEKYKDQSFRLYLGAVRTDVLSMLPGQFPAWEDASPSGDWCFVTCRGEVAANQVQVEGVDAAILQKSHGQITEMVPTTTDTLSPTDLNGNLGQVRAVFAGKHSAAKGCDPQGTSDLYPFGCDALKKIDAHFEKSKIEQQRALAADPSSGLVGATLTTATAVNVRKGLPTMGPNGTNYGCKIEVLRPGQQVKPASTVAMRYANDVFYWLVIDDGRPVTCAPLVAKQ